METTQPNGDYHPEARAYPIRLDQYANGNEKIGEALYKIQEAIFWCQIEDYSPRSGSEDVDFSELIGICGKDSNLVKKVMIDVLKSPINLFARDSAKAAVRKHRIHIEKELRRNPIYTC